jgi:hypothetical protein
MYTLSYILINNSAKVTSEHSEQKMHRQMLVFFLTVGGAH